MAGSANARCPPAQLSGSQPKAGAVSCGQPLYMGTQVGHRVIEVEDAGRSLMLGDLDYLRSLATSLDRLADLCENPKKRE